MKALRRELHVADRPRPDSIIDRYQQKPTLGGKATSEESNDTEDKDGVGNLEGKGVLWTSTRAAMASARARGGGACGFGRNARVTGSHGLAGVGMWLRTAGDHSGGGCRRGGSDAAGVWAADNTPARKGRNEGTMRARWHFGRMGRHRHSGRGTKARSLARAASENEGNSCAEACGAAYGAKEARIGGVEGSHRGERTGGGGWGQRGGRRYTGVPKRAPFSVGLIARHGASGTDEAKQSNEGENGEEGSRIGPKERCGDLVQLGGEDA